MILFNEEAHTYTVNGVEFKSVTTILSAVGVTYYFESQATEIAMIRGSFVHEAIKLFNDGTLDESTLDPVIEPYFQAYKKFMHLTGFKTESWEIVSANTELGYAGTYDVIGILNNKRVLIDFKTGVINKVSCRLQTAAYAHLDSVGKLAARYSLQLKENMDFRLSKPYTNLREDYTKFKACKMVYDLQEARIKNNKIERVR